MSCSDSHLLTNEEERETEDKVTQRSQIPIWTCEDAQCYLESFLPRNLTYQHFQFPCTYALRKLFSGCSFKSHSVTEAQIKKDIFSWNMTTHIYHQVQDKPKCATYLISSWCEDADTEAIKCLTFFEKMERMPGVLVWTYSKHVFPSSSSAIRVGGYQLIPTHTRIALWKLD